MAYIDPGTVPLQLTRNRDDIPCEIRPIFENGAGLMDLVFLDQWIRQHDALRKAMSPPTDADTALVFSPPSVVDPLPVDCE